MKKTIKDLFKLITAIATVAGILYVARDQIKAIIAKIKEVSDDDFDDDFDDESFDDDSFDDDEIFPEPSKDDRDYVSINITDTDDDPSVAEEETQETETPSEESDEKLGRYGLGSAETHVKDFMIRHKKMLGLSDEDVAILKILKDKGL